MMRSEPDADDTVRIVPRQARTPARGPWQWVAAGAAAAALAMGIAGWLVWPRQAPQPVPMSASRSVSTLGAAVPLPQPAFTPQQPPAQQEVPPQQSALGRQAELGQQAAPTQQEGPGQQAAPTQPLASGQQPPGQQLTLGQQAVPGPQLAPAQRSIPALRPPSTQQQAFVQPAPFQRLPAQPSPTQPFPVQPLPEPALPVLSLASIRTADEAEIRAHVPTSLTVFRFTANPSIIVLDFASLRQQGLMLNRIAALTEKGAMPRNRVLNDLELGQAISAGGDTVETFYYGHDYSAASIARFFALAAQQRVELNPEETRLRQFLALLGWLSPDARGGLISVPAVGANAEVTVAARNAILRHELSHGEYFSNPGYAAYVHQFWSRDLTQSEQAGVRNFLASDEYDPKLEELVENEMQAYLMFTRDPLFFAPEKVGMTPERLAELQMEFHRGMPHGWLRDLLGRTLPIVASPY
jgi:hypothetical protein